MAVTWTRYFQQVSNANTLINYADSVFVKDESWNDEQEKNLWQRGILFPQLAMASSDFPLGRHPDDNGGAAFNHD